MKHKKEKAKKRIAGISYLEISILIVAIFSFSYIISGVETVSAETSSISDNNVCCEKAVNGSTCASVENPSQCDSNFQKYPVSCDADPGNCKKGCCLSQSNGLCNPMTPKMACETENGTFSDDQQCSNADCRQGCCHLGSDVQWTTYKNCQFLGNSQIPSIPTNWILDENTDSQLKCMYSPYKDKEGACVYYSGDERTCIFTTFDDCISRTGNETNFDQRGKFCSDSALNTTCKAHDHKGCIEGKEDVYWFDSCENHEDVSDDCNLFAGSYCGKSSGNYICKDINCVVHGQARKNGESWCEYDNVIGNGKDPAGSRHVRHMCYMGSEMIQPCADYRNEICVEDQSAVSSGGTISQAACRVNNWRQCLELNAKKNVDAMKTSCQKNPDCVLKHIDMAGSFNFWVCSNAYPPGFDLSDFGENGATVGNSGDSICSIATQQCTETWQCCLLGCFCVDNCLCHTSTFTSQMNDLCISLGDCGGYINYKGVYTDGGYGVNGAPRVNMAGMAANGGKKPAPPGDMEFFDTLSPTSLTDLSKYEDSPALEAANKNLNEIKKQLDSLRVELQNAMNAGDENKIRQISDQYNKKEAEYNDALAKLNVTSSGKTAFQLEIEKVSGTMGSPLLTYILSKENTNSSLDASDLSQVTASPVNSVGYFNSFSSVRSAISAQIVKKDSKSPDLSMLIAMIAALIAYIITQSILIALLAALIAFLLSMCWIVYKYIDFRCNIWERPSGGADCNSCNTVETPCSEYRCQSLGQDCQFVNKGTENELCLSKPTNSAIPTIQPYYSIISPGYKYDLIQPNGFEVRTDDGKCIDPYTIVTIGITVDPFAKCRIGGDPKQKWEEMLTDFGEYGNSILPAHQMNVFLLSPEALKSNFQGGMCNQSGVMKLCNMTDEQIENLGKVTYYVKCKTSDGKQNIDPYEIKTCVNPGPDLTPPRIFEQATNPASNSYVKYGQTNQTLSIFTSEPSECRWSSEPNKKFEDMENTYNCDLNLLQIQGFFCTTNLIVQNDSTYYTKCRDMSENKNTMTKDYIYDLKVTKTPLKIVDMVPANGEERIFGGEPVTLTLKVETSGGAEDGLAKCMWKEPQIEGFMDYFPDEDSKVHSYLWNRGRKGLWNIIFNCEDIAGNVAENSTTFKILIDDTGPNIIRIFNDGGIRVTTDELARCKYDSMRNFYFDNATEMDSDFSFQHAGPWEGRTYYVQCKDIYGNLGTKMSTQPYEAFSK